MDYFFINFVLISSSLDLYIESYINIFVENSKDISKIDEKYQAFYNNLKTVNCLSAFEKRKI